MTASPSPYPQNFGSGYPWGNNFRDNYQSVSGGYPDNPQMNMRQAILRQQDQRRLQYLQQLQGQPMGFGQNGNQPETDGTKSLAVSQGSPSPASNPSVVIDNSLAQPDHKPSSKIAADTTMRDVTPAAQAPTLTADAPSNTDPCKKSGSSTSSWGHPVWWGWSETNGCEQ